MIYDISAAFDRMCLYIYSLCRCYFHLNMLNRFDCFNYFQETINTIKNRPYGTRSMNRSVLHQGLLGGIQNIYRGKDSSDCLSEPLAASDRQGPAPAPRGFVREGPGGGTSPLETRHGEGSF